MSQTTEIQIQNQNGLSFRTKLNQMLSALNTVFAGTTAPTVTEADMLWMDTSISPNVLKRRNSSNTAWEVCPVVEGAVHLAAGKSTPANNDEFAIIDSTSGNVLKKILWSEIKTELLKGGNLTGPFNANSGGTLASASTVNIGAATGEYITISGTTTITAFDTAQAGTMREVRFSGALTLTHNATSLILPTSANITTIAGDCATFRSEGSGNWRCVKYQRFDGSPLASGTANQRMSLVTSVATTSGTSVLFSSIPSWAKRITVLLRAVSTTGSSPVEIRLGTSSGIESTGYTAYEFRAGGAGTGAGSSTSGFPIISVGNAAYARTGAVTLELLSGNIWICSGNAVYDPSAPNGFFVIGNKTTAATLDRVSITTVGGTETFDNGEATILIEGYA